MNYMRFRRIAARVFNTPLLLTPDAAAIVANVVGERLGIEPLEISMRASRDLFGAEDDDDTPYAIDSEGIATIPVHGELVNRGSWMDSLSGLTSYEKLRGALTQAAADNQVRGIVLDIDSPGGEAAGAFETAEFVRSISNEKKVVAYVDSLAASAAYAIAAGASEIITPVSGTLGSIGVVLVHLDRSQAMKDRGLKPTLLHAGAFKVDGNSFEPMPDEARARIQSQVEDVYSLFVDTVGRLRHGLGSEGARKTEAGVFIGQRAVGAGLADRLGDRASVATAFPPRKLPYGIRSSIAMTDQLVHTQAALETAVSAAVENTRRDEAANRQAAVDSARIAARTEERERIRSILDSEPAKGRANLARHLALSSDMAPEAAATILSAAAPEAEQQSRLDANVPRQTLSPNAPDAPTDARARGAAEFARALGKTAA